MASIRSFGINRSKLNSFFSKSKLKITVNFNDFWSTSKFCHLFNGNAYLARLTVVLDGPFTIKFLKPPAKVRLPLPRDTDTDCKFNGSKCSMPNSGMPVEWNQNFRLICQFYNDFELKRLPLASIGNIPSNICRKQSSSVGLSLLHCFNQSAANKTNQSKYINVHLTQLNVEKKRTKKCLNWVETYIHLTEEIEKPNFKIFHFFVSTKYEVRYNMQRECAVH